MKGSFVSVFFATLPQHPAQGNINGFRGREHSLLITFYFMLFFPTKNIKLLYFLANLSVNYYVCVLLCKISKGALPQTPSFALGANTCANALCPSQSADRGSLRQNLQCTNQHFPSAGSQKQIKCTSGAPLI